MANTHSTLKETTTKVTKNNAMRDSSQRYYTIGYRPNEGKPHPLPQLTIKGRWLQQLGFLTGLPVIITAERGKLIIELEHQI